MPISENELMWSGPEQERRQSDGIVSSPEDPSVEVDCEAADSDVQDQTAPSGVSDAASRLEATLARLEMSSLEMKLYLDSIEQRISRIEPYLQGLPQASAKPDPAAPSKGPAAASVPAGTRPTPLAVPPAEEVTAGDPVVAAAVVPESWAAARQSPPWARRVRVGTRETRWSQMMESASEEIADADMVEPSPLPDAGLWERQREGAFEATAPLPGETGAQAKSIETPVALRNSVAPIVFAEAGMESQGTRSLITAEAASFVATQVLAAQTARLAEPDATPSPAADETGSQHGVRLAEPMRVVSRRAAPPEMEVDDLPAENLPTTGRTWRGYRVVHLVLGAILLAMGAAPAAIWWRTSTTPRETDMSDVSSMATKGSGGESQAGGGSSERPGGVPADPRIVTSGGQGGRAGSLAASARLPDSASAASSVPPTSRARTDMVDAAPVTRRLPERGSAAAAAQPARIGSATAGLSEPTAAAGQDADVVPGTSAMRVRVPSDVMAGRLLPGESAALVETASETGAVVAVVFISNTGRVEDVQVVSGQQPLRASAMRAMRNWRYEPYLENGVRVPVVTTATIRFGGAQ